MATQRAHWTSRLTFILATAGSAVGLGNVWKFPYITGMNGGGTFVLIYLGSILCLGLPILLAELYVGKKSQSNLVTAFEVIHKPKSPWRIFGAIGVLSAFLIISFYSVVGGWILDFLRLSVVGLTQETDPENALGTLLGSPARQTLLHFLFCGITAAIVARGVNQGLERINKLLMPLLMVLLLLLLGHSFFLPGFEQALSFLFKPSSENLSASGILEAVGHSFFTLSLGVGCILTYGSYLDEKTPLARTALAVIFLDTLIALIAGIIIFSVVFSFEMEPAAGPPLVFHTLPTLFAKLSGGSIMSLTFFVLLTFAAITSAVSILELIVAYVTERFSVARTKATYSIAFAVFTVGLLTVGSFNILAEVKILGLTFFDLFDKLTSHYLLPLNGLIMAVFVGWVLGRKAINEILSGLPSTFQTAFLWVLRVISPALVLTMIWNKIKDLL